MQGDFRVFDCDSHFMEPADLWLAYLPPELHDRAPKAHYERERNSIDGRPYSTIKLKRTAMLNEMWDTVYGRYSSRGWDRESYVLAMDDQGIDKMALFPSMGLMQVGAWGLDPHLAGQIVHAYNSWVFDWMKPWDGRFVGIGQVDLRNVDQAQAEARRCVQELGFRALYVLPTPPLPGVTLERPYYDPLWSTLEELDAPLALHNVAGTGLDQIGHDRYGDWATPRIAFAFPLESQMALFSFLMGGICERHPNLRLLVTESGAGWLPFWLWWLDELWERYEPVDLPTRLPLKPSDYFRRQCFISAEMEEPTLPDVIHHLGADCVVTASDFPHPEGTFPNGVKDFAARDDLSDSTKQKILWDNPCRLYGTS